MSLRIVPVIFARLDSQRLPGKVLKPLLGGKSIVEELLYQLDDIAAQIPGVARPIIATTARSVDEPIVQVASDMGVDVLRGHLLPLMRLRDIASAHSQDWLWRLNADSPLILQPLIEKAAGELHFINDDVQVITNLADRSFPYGVSLEIFRAGRIIQINAGQTTPQECEHLTPLTLRFPPQSIRGIVASDLGLSHFDSSVRLTVDDAEDAAFFHSLWDDPDFQSTRAGSVERVEYAYRRRLSNAT